MLSFTPDDFERAVLEDRFEQACGLLIEFLEKIVAGGVIEAYDEEKLSREYTWWAQRITLLLGAPGFTPSPDAFGRLTYMHQWLTTLYGCSDHGSSDQLRAIVAEQLVGMDPLDPGMVAQILLSYSLDSAADFDVAAFMKAAPDLTWRAYFGIMSSHIVMTPKAHQNRQRLLAAGPELEGL